MPECIVCAKVTIEIMLHENSEETQAFLRKLSNLAYCIPTEKNGPIDLTLPKKSVVSSVVTNIRKIG